MPFADDIVLVDETRVGINLKLEVWRLWNLKCLGLSRTRIDYVYCNFSRSRTSILD